IARVTGIGVSSLFLAAYAVTMAGLFAASVVLARRLGFSWWAVTTFLLLLTLRHRIAKTGANSLEGYMHPRMMAFVCGVAASAAAVRARGLWATIWTALAAFMHPTTGMWFGLMLGVGVAAARPQWRRALIVAGVAATAVAIWLLTVGPLAGR